MDDYTRLCRAAAHDPRAALTLRDRYTREALVGAVWLPGLAHAVAHATLTAPIALQVLADAVAEAGLVGGRQGDAVWFTGDADPEPLFEVLGTTAGRRLQPAAAVDHGEVFAGPDGDLHGTTVERVRTLLRLARVGEVMATPAAVDAVTLPDGVGQFGAPAPIAARAGFPVTVWRDYR